MKIVHTKPSRKKDEDDLETKLVIEVLLDQFLEWKSIDDLCTQSANREATREWK